MSDQESTIIARLVAAQGRRHRLVLEELRDDEGTPVPLYVRQLTLAERDKLRQAMVAGDTGEAHYNAEIAIRCAQLQDGTPAFTKADKPTLMRSVAASVMARIAYAATHSMPVEDAEKN